MLQPLPLTTNSTSFLLPPPLPPPSTLPPDIHAALTMGTWLGSKHQLQHPKTLLLHHCPPEPPDVPLPNIRTYSDLDSSILHQLLHPTSPSHSTSEYHTLYHHLFPLSANSPHNVTPIPIHGLYPLSPTHTTDSFYVILHGELQARSPLTTHPVLLSSHQAFAIPSLPTDPVILISEAPSLLLQISLPQSWTGAPDP